MSQWGGITGVMVPADRIQGQGCDFYRPSLQVAAQPQIHELPLTLFSICHIVLFGNASLLHTRAVFRSGRCFVTVTSLFVMSGVFLLALADVPPHGCSNLPSLFSRLPLYSSLASSTSAALLSPTLISSSHG